MAKTDSSNSTPQEKPVEPVLSWADYAEAAKLPKPLAEAVRVVHGLEKHSAAEWGALISNLLARPVK